MSIPPSLRATARLFSLVAVIALTALAAVQLRAAPSVTVAPGAEVLSDPLPGTFPAERNLS